MNNFDFFKRKHLYIFFCQLAGCENNDKEEQLEELVNRLENVTKRLENISVHGAIQTQDIAVQTCAPFSKEPTPAASLSEEDFSTSSTLHFNQQTIPDQSANMSLAAYENLLSGSVREYVEISQKIGGDVAEHSKLVEKVFKLVASPFYDEIVNANTCRINCKIFLV